MCSDRPQSTNCISTSARSSMRPCGPRISPAQYPEHGSADPWLASAGAAASIDSAAVSPMFANVCQSCSMSHPLGSTHAAVVTAAVRSEEHTSELQSLMRISYAVFCLKKKTQNNVTTSKQH